MKLTSKQKDHIENCIGAAWMGGASTGLKHPSLIKDALAEIIKTVETADPKKESEQLKVAKITVEEIRKEFGVPENMPIEIEGFINEEQAIQDVADVFKQFEEKPKTEKKVIVVNSGGTPREILEKISKAMDRLGIDKKFTRPNVEKKGGDQRMEG